MTTLPSVVRRGAVALAMAAAALAPLPAAAAGSMNVDLTGSSLVEPAWGETIPAPVTLQLSEPAATDMTLTVGFTRYTGTYWPSSWDQTRTVTISAGEVGAVATFAIVGDDRDVAATYISQVIAAPAGVSSGWAFTPVTDTTRDGELFCSSGWDVDLVAPTDYTGTPTGFCPNEEKSWGSVTLPDGSGTLTGVSHHTSTNIVDPYRTAPAVGDLGRTSGDVTRATWSVGPLSIEAWGMHTEAAATCASLGGEPTLDLASGIDRLVIRQASGVPGVPAVVLDLGPIHEPKTYVLGEWLIALNYTQILHSTASGPWMNGAPQPKVAAVQYAVYIERRNPKSPYWASLAKSDVVYPNGSPCNA